MFELLSAAAFLLGRGAVIGVGAEVGRRMLRKLRAVRRRRSAAPPKTSRY